MMDLNDLLRLLESRTGPAVVVCEMEIFIARLLGANTTEVMISKETVIKQAEHHPDIKAEHYEMLPDAVTRGLLVHEHTGPGRFTICYENMTAPGKRFKVTGKCTKDGKEIYVTGFHRVKKRYTRSVLRRGTVLRWHQ